MGTQTHRQTQTNRHTYTPTHKHTHISDMSRLGLSLARPAGWCSVEMRSVSMRASFALRSASPPNPLHQCKGQPACSTTIYSTPDQVTTQHASVAPCLSRSHSYKQLIYKRKKTCHFFLPFHLANPGPAKEQIWGGIRRPFTVHLLYVKGDSEERRESRKESKYLPSFRKQSV